MKLYKVLRDMPLAKKGDILSYDEESSTLQKSDCVPFLFERPDACKEWLEEIKKTKIYLSWHETACIEKFEFATEEQAERFILNAQMLYDRMVLGIKNKRWWQFWI